MKYAVPLIILLSVLYAQAIVGSWEMVSPYTKKGKRQGADADTAPVQS